MVEMVMGAVGVTKCHTSLQLLCLLQSVTFTLNLFYKNNLRTTFMIAGAQNMRLS